MKKPFYKIIMHGVMKLLVKDALVLASVIVEFSTCKCAGFKSFTELKEQLT